MFELTDTLTYAAPVMLSVLVAKTVADALEVGLHGAPFVPLERTVRSDENDNEDDHDHGADLDHFHHVPSEVVYNRCVHLVTECHRVLAREGKGADVEGEAAKGVVDVLLQQFEWRVDAARVRL